MKRKRLGVIVNPIAGMGGKVGLKGTDSFAILEEARKRGATPVSPGRAVKALKRIAALRETVEIITYPHEMGEDEANECGFQPTVLGSVKPGKARAQDTRNAAKELLRSKVDLLLFAGGDGTARDIYDAVRDKIPILGIPTGVKMHSAVYGTTPENAGSLAALYLGKDFAKFRLHDVEVMDIDEDAVRQNRLSAMLYGYVKVPYQRSLIQSAKAGMPIGGEAALDGACWDVINNLEEDCLYIVGPGTTTKRLMERLGLKGTLLGVDAIRDRILIGSDLNENQLLQLMEGKRTKIIVTVIGGHGCLFGRGNQQISPDVIKHAGRQNIIIVSTMEKICLLQTRSLFVDTGDDETDEMLRGYISVITGLKQSTMLRIAS